MRDLNNKPYTPDEQRVADYLVERTKGMIGAGDDPIGFLMASHAMAMFRLNTVREALDNL